jgi:succinyl-CoA synthetase beta subunit
VLLLGVVTGGNLYTAVQQHLELVLQAKQLKKFCVLCVAAIFSCELLFSGKTKSL